MATKIAERTNQSAPRHASRDNLPAERQQNAPDQQRPAGPPPIVQFRDYVNQRMMTLEETLPPHINPTYFVSAIMVALQKKPSLLKCTFASIWNACVEAAKDGLLPDGKEGAIVPYGENADGKRIAELATWMPMIEGFRKKIFETGKVKAWEVQVVFEKDDFEYELGDNAFIKHRPYIGTQSAGGMVGAYSIAKLSSGETVREVMSAYQIMQVASKSKASTGPWKDAAFAPEMARKVVARRHYKQLPHSRELSEMIARDDARFGVDFNEGDEAIAPKPTSRRITGRQAMDTYAGTTIEGASGERVDEDGVVHDDNSDFQSDEPDRPAAASDRKAGQSNQNQQPATQSVEKSRAADTASSQGADASTSSQASAPTNQDAAPATGGPAGAGADAEAGAIVGSAAPASKGQSGESSPGASDGQDDLLFDDGGIRDGADRPWPPGSVPTDEAEYERYLVSQLAAITDPDQVAPWWKSNEQTEMRSRCKVGVQLNKMQQMAINRRKELNSLKETSK